MDVDGANVGTGTTATNHQARDPTQALEDEDDEEPVLCQADLLSGCKLQMRGSLSGVSSALTTGADSRFATALWGVEDLALAKGVREGALSVIRFERARACVYGTWVTPPATANAKATATATAATTPLPTPVQAAASASAAAAAARAVADRGVGSLGLAQKGTLCCMCGPAGSGKRTLAGAIACDLGRQVRSVHVSDVLASRTGSGTDLASLEAVVRDARLSDAVVVIDGFEHVVAEEGAASEGGKLHLMLSRILEILHAFPGLAVLLCHIDNPQNMTLQRDFASRLYCLLRFSAQQTPHEVRAKQWRSLMPAAAPLEGPSGSGSSAAGSGGVNFAELGRRFELTPGSIQAAIARACAEAAMRADSEGDIGTGTGTGTGAGAGTGGVVRQKDLVAAGEAEVNKLRGGMSFDMMSKLFT